jgi:hypothetical protein
VNEVRARQILRADAIFALAMGILLLLGTWDGLYDALDLPQAKPALLVQIGGALLIGFAYLLWVAPEARALERQVAVGAALAKTVAVLLIVGWLLFKGSNDLGIEDLGTGLLIAVAVVLAGLAAAEVQIADRERA